MGLDANGTRFLLYARAQGVRFDRTATLGRQRLYLDAATLQRNLNAGGVAIDPAGASAMLERDGGYAEPFLQRLGATTICSIDASPYEQATRIVDFNEPVPSDLVERFTVVLDGGTLEHVFNFPVAMRNAMQMVAVGGHLLAITPANNFFGHGFYQFSPELFFRIFSADNGFALDRMLLFEDRPDADWFEVADPKAAGERVLLVNATPTYLLIIARRAASVPIFASPPQQSDYVTQWGTGSAKAATAPAGRSALARLLPGPVRRWLSSLRSRPGGPSLQNPRFFRRLGD